MPRLTAADTPDWLALALALACPECGSPCWITTSGGMVCPRVPAHTGLIGKGLWEERVKTAYALALARSMTALTPIQVIALAKKYLQSGQTKSICQEEKKDGEA